MNFELKKVCFGATDIMLPDFNKVDGTKWAVIACDQFTSEEEYWKATEEIVGDAPSTLRMILPELYLGKEDEKRIADIHAAMAQYEEKVLIEHKNSMIYLRRTCPTGKVREGLVGKIEGLTKMHILTEGMSSSSGDLMMDSTFASAEALAAYQKHPLHVAIADGLVRPSMASRLSYEYEV